MKTLELSDGTTLQVEDVSTVTAMIIINADYSGVDAIRGYITEENLKNAKLIDGSKETTLVNIIPVNVETYSRYEGNVTIRLNLREKTEIELMREELNSIHSEQEIQDEAIDFLAMN